MSNNQVITFPKEWVIGFGARGKFNTETNPLSFITPGGTDSAAINRIATVQQWVSHRHAVNNPQYKHEMTPNPDGTNSYTRVDNPDHQPFVEDEWIGSFVNDPVSGFKVDKVVSRYRTNNKWFEIIDPRGFKVQITADNFVELAEIGGISKGKFIGKYLWGRNKQLIWLASVDHPLVVNQLQVATSAIPDIGTKATLSDGTDAIYLGRFYVIKFDSYGGWHDIYETMFMSYNRKVIGRRFDPYFAKEYQHLFLTHHNNGYYIRGFKRIPKYFIQTKPLPDHEAGAKRFYTEIVNRLQWTGWSQSDCIFSDKSLYDDVWQALISDKIDASEAWGETSAAALKILAVSKKSESELFKSVVGMDPRKDDS